MTLSLRLGRLGPMLITLNYTWLPVGGLGLWILALVWLPPYLNGPPGGAAWALAAGIVLLYGASLLVAEAVRTGVAGIFSAQWPRSVHLCPFGAAVAYPLDEISPSRAMAVAVAAPVTLGLLSAGYALAGQGLAWVGAPALDGVLRALTAATGGAALLGLLPALPLAGGWLLVALLRWLDVDTERAMAVPEFLGLAGVLGLLLAAGSLLVGGGDWVGALSLLAAAWALREGATVIDERMLGGAILTQVTAGAVMQRPVATVGPEQTLAAVFHGRNYGTARVLPVQDAVGHFLGLLPLELADTLLQGTWPRTAVASVMVPAATLPLVPADLPLPHVLDLLGHNRALGRAPHGGAAPVDPLADPNVGYVAVVEQGHLCGVIGWDQVAEYDRMGAAAGVPEAAALDGQLNPAWRRFAWVTLVLMVLVGVPLLANVGTRLLAPAAQARAQAAAPSTGPAIRFSQRTPAAGAVIPRGILAIEVAISSPAPVQTVTLSIDGTSLPAVVHPAGGTRVTASAATLTEELGTHIIQVAVEAEGGLTGQANWNIEVIPETGKPRGTVLPTLPEHAPR